MKKIIVVLVMALLISVTFTGYVGSATNSGNISVTATLAAGTPDATFKVYRAPDGGNIDFGTDYTAMNFNRWTIVQRTGKPAQWISADHFVIVAWTNGMGRRYEIRSEGSGSFVSGANTLPAPSFGCLPVYSPQDMWDLDNDGNPETPQGSMPSGATLAQKFAAITSARAVYTSENPGSARIIQVRYTFPPYNTDGGLPYTGYAHIPTSQASGTYTGPTVKVSIVAL